MTINLDEIKALRKRLGFTQSELAKRSGVSQSLVAKIEAGKIDPTYSKALQIMDTLQSLMNQDQVSVGRVMNSRVISVTPRTNVKNIITIMKRHSFSQMPVIDKGVLVGVVSEMSILDAIMEGKHHSNAQDVMGEAPPTLAKSALADVAYDLLKFYPMVLVQEKGVLCGLVTRADIIRKMVK
ncbi:MAG: CBS domain-containing protein [archaeon]